MIPIHLTIEGLYSYQTRQEIDFSQLNDAGLFGIFGSVGSGKSSILEAISFALYGETERLNSKDLRAYNMMNLKSNRSFIALEFLNYENKIFRVEREYRRNSKKFEDIKHSYTTFYEKINEKWVPIDQIDIEKIVGMSYVNFKRTVIIPQGQFKEFLELSEKDRTQMLQEIFHLNRFDLSAKTSELYNKNHEKLTFKEGEIQAYQNTSLERCNSLESQFKSISELLSKISTKTEIEYARLQIMEKLKEKIEELEVKEERKRKLELNTPAINQKQKEIQEYEEINRLFSGKFSVFEDKNSKMAILHSTIEKDELKLKHLKFSLDEEEKQFAPIKKNYLNIDIYQKRLNDYTQLIHRATLIDEIEHLEKRTENGTKAIEENKRKLHSEKLFLTEYENELKHLKTQLIPTEKLLEIGKWYDKYNLLLQQQNESKFSISKIEDELKNIERQLTANQWDWQHTPNEFLSKKKDYKLKINQLEEQLSTVEVHEKLSAYTTQLHETGVCPLCGSKKHPNILETNDVEREKTILKQEITLLKQQVEAIDDKEKEFAKLLNEKKTQDQLLQTAVELSKSKEHNVLEHNKLFQWRDFCTDEKDFELKKSNSLRIENQIEQLQQKIKNTQTTIDECRQNDEKYNNGIKEFQTAIDVKKEQRKIAETSLQALNFLDVKEFSKQELEKKQSELQTLINQTVKNYQEILEKIQFDKQAISKIEGIYEANLLSLKQLKEEIYLVEKELNDLIITKNFSSIENVKAILKKDWDVAELQKQINEFHAELNMVNLRINQLKEVTKNERFSTEDYETQLQSCNELKNQLEQLTKESTLLEKEWKEQEKSLKEKQELEEKLHQLKTREENLKLIKKLFNGLGFVQYIANVYLRQLCDVANQRFLRMTRNQLSLSINEKGQLEIIDYLNDGKARSVKTLSGGQSFQASLSLALALAESTQSPELKKKFFFIDEGFGTQDSESVHIIFETLAQLQSESHIVGIISHLEALKEQIPFSLSITKTNEGSIIQTIKT